MNPILTASIPAANSLTARSEKFVELELTLTIPQAVRPTTGVAKY